MNEYKQTEINLRNGWSLYVEYEPYDEDNDLWGWTWALTKEDECGNSAYRIDGWCVFNASSLFNFGPFDSESDAIETGIRCWDYFVTRAQDFERMCNEALDNWIKFEEFSSR